jgi:CMP-N-acetylneuraminic acid synthetase
VEKPGRTLGRSDRFFQELVPKPCALAHSRLVLEQAHIIQHSLTSDCFDDIFVDTNSDEITEYAETHKVKTIKRLESLAENTANGNDLLVYLHRMFPQYDYYFQLFATAPFLQPESTTSP